MRRAFGRAVLCEGASQEWIGSETRALQALERRGLRNGDGPSRASQYRTRRSGAKAGARAQDPGPREQTDRGDPAPGRAHGDALAGNLAARGSRRGRVTGLARRM